MRKGDGADYGEPHLLQRTTLPTQQAENQTEGIQPQPSRARTDNRLATEIIDPPRRLSMRRRRHDKKSQAISPS